MASQVRSLPSNNDPSSGELHSLAIQVGHKANMAQSPNEVITCSRDAAILSVLSELRSTTMSMAEAASRAVDLNYSDFQVADGCFSVNGRNFKLAWLGGATAWLIHRLDRPGPLFRRVVKGRVTIDKLTANEVLKMYQRRRKEADQSSQGSMGSGAAP